MRLYRQKPTGHARMPPGLQNLVTESCVLGFPRPTFRLSREAEAFWREIRAFASHLGLFI
jgi:hypothetical protein